MAYTTTDKPSLHFNTILWTGDGDTAANKTGTGFKPDWTWIKKRTNDVEDHAAFDSSRGLGGKLLNPNATAQQETAGNNGYISAFLDDGFSIATNGSDSYKWAYLNESSDTFVAWNWKANGGTTSSNSNGSITSTVQVNSDSGFSIVKWTGTGSAATIGHGLSGVPNLIIVKNLNKSSQWGTYHHNVGNAKYLAINDNDAEATYSGYWNDTTPTATVFSVGSDGDVSGGSSQDVIAYCFKSTKGFSKFGEYIGNASTDGPMVFLGFKPAFVMIKRYDSSANWHMYDNKRDVSNVVETAIQANTTGVEFTTSNKMDFLSNGFRITAGNETTTNASGGNYIFLAFAENPFVTSTGVPATAR